MNGYLCYLLLSSDSMRTYVGITNNMTRRLRQHNGELSGGAKYTSRETSRPWTLVLTITGFETKIQALQFEWAFHHMKGGRGLKGRLDKLLKLLCKPKWTHSAPLASIVPLCITLHARIDANVLLRNLPSHCTMEEDIQKSFIDVPQTPNDQAASADATA